MMIVDSEDGFFLTFSSMFCNVTAGNLYLINVVANLEFDPRRIVSSTFYQYLAVSCPQRQDHFLRLPVFNVPKDIGRIQSLNHD